MRRAKHVERMIGMLNAYVNLVVMPETKILFVKIRSWEDNIERNLMEIGCI
jgi:hypothetical protein